MVAHSSILAVARTGATSILLHPLRTLATMTCLLAMLVPYLAGLGVSQGIEREAAASIQFGADLYVSEEQIGHGVPIPLSVLPSIRSIPDVTSVIPRLVGQVTIGTDSEPAVVVGLPAASGVKELQLVSGRYFREGAENEMVVGTELARRLHLTPGSRIPPFYRNEMGEHVSEVVGLFRSDVPFWQSRMILTSFKTASAIFAQEGHAGDFLVYCRPGTVETVRRRLLRQLGRAGGHPELRLNVITRSDVAALLPKGIGHGGGLFQLHFLLAFVAGVLVVTVSSAIGLPDRRREVGILKATGWQTDEILLRGVVESTLVSVAAASAALLIAFVWLRVLNGIGIASLFLQDTGLTPSFAIPFQLTPAPALIGFLFAWLLVSLGTVSASWRAAVVPPREAMR